jgi:hypothetical protein
VRWLARHLCVRPPFWHLLYCARYGCMHCFVVYCAVGAHLHAFIGARKVSPLSRSPQFTGGFPRWFTLTQGPTLIRRRAAVQRGLPLRVSRVSHELHCRCAPPQSAARVLTGVAGQHGPPRPPQARAAGPRAGHPHHRHGRGVPRASLQRRANLHRNGLSQMHLNWDSIGGCGRICIRTIRSLGDSKFGWFSER